MKVNKKSLAIAIVGFFVVLLMLTILSRAIASLAVVEVKVSTISSQTISNKVKATGVTQALQEIAIRTEPGQTIEVLFVASGDAVVVNDPLFKVDMNELASNITELEEDRYLTQLDIEVLLMQIEDTRTAAAGDNIAKEDVSSLQTANTDTAIAELELQVSRAIIERDRLDKKLAGLYSLQEADGIVYATAKGIVRDVWLRAGDTTMESAVLSIADDSAGSKLVFSVESDTAEHYRSDAVVTVTKQATQEIIEGVEVSSIIQNSSTPTLMDVTLHLPAGSVSIDSTLDVSITISSETYSSCIPLNALHQSSNSQTYVFVIEEKQTSLGAEKVVRIVYVTVIAKDNSWAAIEGLSSNQLVVTESAKVLTDEDRVLVI